MHQAVDLTFAPSPFPIPCRRPGALSLCRPTLEPEHSVAVARERDSRAARRLGRDRPGARKGFVLTGRRTARGSSRRWRRPRALRPSSAPAHSRAHGSCRGPFTSQAEDRGQVRAISGESSRTRACRIWAFIDHASLTLSYDSAGVPQCHSLCSFEWFQAISTTNKQCPKANAISASRQARRGLREPTFVTGARMCNGPKHQLMEEKDSLVGKQIGCR